MFENVNDSLCCGHAGSRYSGPWACYPWQDKAESHVGTRVQRCGATSSSWGLTPNIWCALFDLFSILWSNIFQKTEFENQNPRLALDVFSIPKLMRVIWTTIAQNLELSIQSYSNLPRWISQSISMITWMCISTKRFFCGTLVFSNVQLFYIAKHDWVSFCAWDAWLNVGFSLSPSAAGGMMAFSSIAVVSNSVLLRSHRLGRKAQWCGEVQHVVVHQVCLPPISSVHSVLLNAVELNRRSECQTYRTEKATINVSLRSGCLRTRV